MKKMNLLVVAMIAVLPAVSQAQDVQTFVGANYEHGSVHVGSSSTSMDGVKFQAGSQLKWGTLKGTAATLSGEGAEYDNYSVAVEKPFNIEQSNVFISPEAGITYTHFENDAFNNSDFGLMAGASAGYNFNKQFQIVSNYNHSFGMKPHQDNIDEDSVSVGLNYRFN
ncbi:porin family protein [Photobacterium sp. SDRW27]|uniref:outer membrane beta-barrel protein n=1 Tax=Photobacterium obscurum TaxID=2829490 RepID=UPI002244A763|nr:outer membrane beta-barrel protein [Photobacterium obscurum]MCW8330243.1 porin family protein [Photobacterium obscurum]